MRRFGSIVDNAAATGRWFRRLVVSGDNELSRKLDIARFSAIAARVSIAIARCAKNAGFFVPELARMPGSGSDILELGMTLARR